MATLLIFLLGLALSGSVGSAPTTPSTSTTCLRWKLVQGIGKVFCLSCHNPNLAPLGIPVDDPQMEGGCVAPEPLQCKEWGFVRSGPEGLTVLCHKCPTGDSPKKQRFKIVGRTGQHVVEESCVDCSPGKYWNSDQGRCAFCPSCVWPMKPGRPCGGRDRGTCVCSELHQCNMPLNSDGSCSGQCFFQCAPGWGSTVYGGCVLCPFPYKSSGGLSMCVPINAQEPCPPGTFWNKDTARCEEMGECEDGKVEVCPGTEVTPRVCMKCGEGGLGSWREMWGYDGPEYEFLQKKCLKGTRRLKKMCRKMNKED